MGVTNTFIAVLCLVLGALGIGQGFIRRINLPMIFCGMVLIWFGIYILHLESTTWLQSH